MGIEDLHALTPIPELDPMSLGVPAAPQAPAPVPQMGQPIQQQKSQKLLSLAALAAMIAGGRATNGLGAGVLQGQQRMEDERQQREQQSIRQAELEQVQYQRQQQAYQQTVQQKQQLAMQATESFRKRVQGGEFKSQREYEQAAMQTSALMQNFYGMRLPPQYFIQSAKFSMPADEDLIYQHLEKTFKNKMPGQVLNPDDTITFKGADKQPRTMKIREAIAASNFPMALGPNGEMAVVGDKPLSPSETAGKAGQFADRLALRLAGGTVPYNTREQKAAVHEQIRKEIDAEEAAAEAARKRADRVTPETTPNAKLEATLKLRDRYVKETQSAQTVSLQLEQMRSALSAVKSGSAAAGSQGVLVTFQKILDPTSVVRESEYARSGAGLSLLNRLDGLAMKWQQGGAGVPVLELETFVRLAEQFVRNQARAAAVTKTQIDSIAQQYGMDPSQITRDIAAEAGVDTADPAVETAPTVGTIKKFPNGKRGRWDGRGWEMVK